jgi:tetratricopeptide (TPR) repeat protein
MTQPANPYVAGSPLRGEQGFFGRQDTLDWVARELRNPATNALVLFGQRRTGKTSLLLQLQRILPADAFLPVYFDLQDLATRPLGQVLADLADTIAEQVDLESPDPAAFDDKGRFFRRTFLSQLYQALSEDRRPIFLLDEFDVLDQVAEAELPETAAAKALFPFLRRVMTEEIRLAFVFVLGRRAEDLSLDFIATFKTALAREIWVLDRESAEALVRQAEGNNTLRFSDQAVTRILSLTSCHPYLTQLLCQRIWERAYAGKGGIKSRPTAPLPILVPEVEAAIPDSLEKGDQALVWLWQGLSPAEKIYAAALAEIADEGKTISEDEVIQVLTAHAARLRTREVELAPRDLVKRRVLEEAGEREYRFAVELFRRWVRQRKLLSEVKDELDRIEPVADRLYTIGKDFFNRRQWETAIRYFRDVLEANPHHFRARLDLSEALLVQGRVDDAVAESQRAYGLDQNEARYALIKALLAQAKEREEEEREVGRARAIYGQVLGVAPRQMEAWKKLDALEGPSSYENLYEEFEIRVEPGRKGQYRVSAHSPGGDDSETMDLSPNDLYLERALLKLQVTLLRSGSLRRQVPTPELEAAQDLGLRLFNALFTGGIRARYDVSIQMVQQAQKVLRIKLNIADPRLAILPWEYLFDQRFGAFLCFSTPLVRYLELPRPLKPLAVTPPLRILGVAVSPRGLPPLSTSQEKELVENALEDLISRGLVYLEWLDGNTWRDLRKAVRPGRESWHILHFIGHGGFTVSRDEGFIALEDERGDVCRLYASDLAYLLTGHPSLRLVVLNSCEGARGESQDIFSSTATVLLRAGLPAVLAMQFAITDQVAVKLAQIFYESLADGLPVDAALVEARLAIKMDIPNSVEWGVPVLYMRTPDGMLFRFTKP